LQLLLRRSRARHATNDLSPEALATVARPSNALASPGTYESLITISVECLKMLAIVNGGAAVAVLTYLGNLAGRTASGQPTNHITQALMCYCGGLLATILAFVLGYLAQLHLYNEESGQVVRKDINGCYGVLSHLCCWQL
jgi:hypothetical protein